MTSNGYRLIDTNTAQKGEFVSLQAGQNARANFLLREVLLRPGKYFVGCGSAETPWNLLTTSSTQRLELSWRARKPATTPSFTRALTFAASNRMSPSANLGIGGAGKLSYKRGLIRLLDRPGGRFLLGKIATSFPAENRRRRRDYLS